VRATPVRQAPPTPRHYCAAPGRTAAGTCTPCPAGTYGDATGLTTSACSGPTTGYACVAGSVNSTPSACPVGRYSLAGAGACTPCAAGLYGATPAIYTSACLHSSAIMHSGAVRRRQLWAVCRLSSRSIRTSVGCCVTCCLYHVYGRLFWQHKWLECRAVHWCVPGRVLLSR
jgi:hypothetical protein